MRRSPSHSTRSGPGTVVDIDIDDNAAYAYELDILLDAGGVVEVKLDASLNVVSRRRTTTATTRQPASRRRRSPDPRRPRRRRSPSRSTHVGSEPSPASSSATTPITCARSRSSSPTATTSTSSSTGTSPSSRPTDAAGGADRLASRSSALTRRSVGMQIRGGGGELGEARIESHVDSLCCRSQSATNGSTPDRQIRGRERVRS